MNFWIVTIDSEDYGVFETTTKEEAIKEGMECLFGSTGMIEPETVTVRHATDQEVAEWEEECFEMDMRYIDEQIFLNAQ